MTDVSNVSDPQDTVEPDYIDVVITHMLHRIWELQATQLFLLADNDEDRAYVQEVLDRQAKGDYTMPMQW